ncbi:MAG: imidazole glycerol phosphate synthase subunit HisF [Methylococcaceae bacterium]|nr:imidazole glycerol phosphate synthase subunit HisF [Methylococcaceae bacterium]
MLRTRVIPCLLLKDGGLVKGQQFKNHKYVGDPINTIKIFNDKEVDELMVLDISASRNAVAPDYTLLEQFASECFMPLCYGGGIKTLEQAKKIFSLGVEKVCLQSSAIEDLNIIRQISNLFGSQSVVVSIDIKSNFLNQKKLFHATKRKSLKLPWQNFIHDCVSAGAGEVLINSVDHEGSMSGVDLNLIQQVSEMISVPVIATGGVGSLKHIKAASDVGASAVAVGSFFVYHGPHRAVLITFPKYQELENLLR